MLRGGRWFVVRLPVKHAVATSGRSVPGVAVHAGGGKASGEMEATQQMWREHRDRLHAFVVRRVADPGVAEDIVHDVLVRALENFDTLRSRDRLESWLFQITRNAIIDHYRSRRPLDALPGDIAESTETASARAELAGCLRPLLEGLPEHYRAALELSEIQGLTQQDTAARLGISLSGAKSRVQRGRRLLHEAILQCCRLEFDSRGTLMGFVPRGTGSVGGDERECGGCGGPDPERSSELIPLRRDGSTRLI